MYLKKKKRVAYGSCDNIRQEKDGKGTKEFTKVGPPYNDLGPGGDAENTFGKSGSQIGFQESVKIESEGTGTKYQSYFRLSLTELKTY